MRFMMGIGAWQEQVDFDWRRIRDNLCLLRPETLAKINRIGKEDEFDGFNDEYRTNETRDSVFGRERQGEADIPLLTVGPLTLTDSGDVYFDFGRAASEDELVEVVDIGKKESKPLFSSQHYKLNTSLRVHFNPLRYQAGGNHLPMIQSYGIEFEVDAGTRTQDQALGARKAFP